MSFDRFALDAALQLARLECKIPARTKAIKYLSKFYSATNTEFNRFSVETATDILSLSPDMKYVDIDFVVMVYNVNNYLVQYFDILETTEVVDTECVEDDQTEESDEVIVESEEVSTDE